LEKSSKVDIVLPTPLSIKKPPHHYALPPHRKPIVALSMVNTLGGHETWPQLHVKIRINILCLVSLGNNLGKYS
jgi:hypothetical protein